MGHMTSQIQLSEHLVECKFMFYITASDLSCFYYLALNATVEKDATQ